MGRAGKPAEEEQFIRDRRALREPTGKVLAMVDACQVDAKAQGWQI